MVIKKEFCLIEFHCSEYHHGNFINIFSKTTGIKTFVLTGGCCQGDIDHILGGYNENEDLTPEEMKKKFHFVDLLSSEGDGSKFEKFKNLQTIKEVDKEIKLEKISLLETNIKRIEGEISQLKKEIED